MLIGEKIPTLIKSTCICGPTWVDRCIERDFHITQWSLGPYQEYRCSWCGGQALLDPQGRLWLEKRGYRVWDYKEQTAWYSQACSTGTI
jgi:hypothetical protein